MTDRLDLPSRYRDQIEVLLREQVPGVEVWAYGSRVNGESHDASDLDLVLRGPNLERIPSGQLADLTEALEQSNVPITDSHFGRSSSVQRASQSSKLLRSKGVSQVRPNSPNRVLMSRFIFVPAIYCFHGRVNRRLPLTLSGGEDRRVG